MEKRSEIKAMKMMVCVTLSMGLSALGLTAGAVVLAGILPAAAESSTRAGKTGPVVVDIDLEKQGAACPKTLWGLFFEDINYAADGVGVKNDRLKIGAPREGALFELPDWTRFETVFTPASCLSVYRIKL